MTKRYDLYDIKDIFEKGLDCDADVHERIDDPSLMIVTTEDRTYEVRRVR